MRWSCLCWVVYLFLLYCCYYSIFGIYSLWLSRPHASRKFLEISCWESSGPPLECHLLTSDVNSIAIFLLAQIHPFWQLYVSMDASPTLHFTNTKMLHRWVRNLSIHAFTSYFIQQAFSEHLLCWEHIDEITESASFSIYIYFIFKYVIKSHGSNTKWRKKLSKKFSS